MHFQSLRSFFMRFPYFAGMQSAGAFKKFILPFSQKLLVLDVGALPMSAYSKRYLQHLFNHHLYYLEIYASVLNQLMRHSSKDQGNIHLVDFGAGNGLLGIFAKFAGFKKVWLCDMDVDFVNASKVLADALYLELDGFINCNVDSLQSALSGEQVDAVVATDVIEHLYSVDHFLAALANMNPAMVTVCTTASNPENFIKCRQLKKLQLQDELLGTDPADSSLAGAEKTEAFLESRKKIIADLFPQLPQTDLLSLSKATRGLIKADIVTAVHAYLQNGTMPQPDTRWANTCNPYTGTWTERILSMEVYKRIYKSQGFELELQNGFYNSNSNGRKRYINFAGNILVKLTGKYAAPFISLIGYKPH